jgi:hypothetical protein
MYELALHCRLVGAYHYFTGNIADVASILKNQEPRASSATRNPSTSGDASDAQALRFLPKERKRLGIETSRQPSPAWFSY